jgi:hypothetical protein
MLPQRHRQRFYDKGKRYDEPAAARLTLPQGCEVPELPTSRTSRLSLADHKARGVCGREVGARCGGGWSPMGTKIE